MTDVGGMPLNLAQMSTQSRETPFTSSESSYSQGMTGVDVSIAQRAESDLAGVSLASGRYELKELVGSGAFGVVYRARHVSLDRDVAVKILFRDIARMHPEMTERFKREARAASQLKHRNTVDVIDFGEEEGLLYLVMEFLDGASLYDFITHGRSLVLEEIVSIMSQVAAALAAAHDHGIIHRDVKPENIMVSDRIQDDGTAGFSVKVLDFGIAKIGVNDDEENSPSLTGRGEIFGTPDYMSPEQAQGKPLDARSDVYAMGVVLYHLVCGQPPFEAETPVGLLMQHLTAQPPPPSSIVPDIPSELEDLILKAMEKEREKRFDDARHMRAALLALVDKVDTRWGSNPFGEDDGSAFRMTQKADSPPVFLPAGGNERADGEDGKEELTEDRAEIPSQGDAPAGSAQGQRRSLFLIAVVLLLTIAGVIVATLVSEPAAPEKPVDPAEARADNGEARADKGETRADKDESPLPKQPEVQADAETVAAEVPELDTSSFPVVLSPRTKQGASHGGLGALLIAGGNETARLVNDNSDKSEEVRRDGRRDRRDRDRRGDASSQSGDNASDNGDKAADKDEKTDNILANAQSDTEKRDSQVGSADESDSIVDSSNTNDPGSDNNTAADPAGSENKDEPDETALVEELVEESVDPVLDASVSIEAINIRGSLPSSVVQQALESQSGKLEGCYRKAAQKEGRDEAFSLRVGFEINVDGFASDVKVGNSPLGVRRCVSNVIGNVRVRQRPDTGTVMSAVTFRFEPRNP